MKLRDLFQRRTDASAPPDPPVPAPVRRPDWPTMPPVQRTVSLPDLITAPDRFPDGLASWRNPSQGGTLGHYVTPDAPAGVSAGLATAAPRGELPAPAPPWWWPRPPAVQRLVPTLAPAPEPPPVSADDTDDPAPTPPPAVPVYPLTGHNLVSAADIESPAPRLVLPAVQRHAAEPETSQAPVADPDVPAGESPPEAPLPSVVAAQPEPLAEISVEPWPDNRPDLPVARRLGLGAPLQRVPDAGGGPWAGSAPVHRHVEVGVQPDAAVDTAPHPDPSPAWSPSAEPTTAMPLPAAATPTEAEPSPLQRRPVQRQTEVQPMDLAPLVSDTPPMTSAAPPAELAARSHFTEPNPSPQPVQRALDTPLPASSGPAQPPPAEPIAAPAGAEPSTVQREVAVEPLDLAPLVSDTPPMASVMIHSAAVPSAEPVAGSRSTGPNPSPQPVQRALDTPLRASSGPARSPSAEPIAAMPLPTVASAEEGLSTVQRRIEAEAGVGVGAGVEPMEVAPLVSGTSPMASVAGSQMPSDPVAIPPVTTPSAPSATPSAISHSPGPTPSPVSAQRTVDTPPQPGPRPVWRPSPEPAAAAPAEAGPSTVQRQIEVVAEAEPMEVAPLVSGSPPMPSVVGSPMPSGDVVSPPRPAPSAEPATGSRSTATFPSPQPVQRAVDTPLRPGQHPMWSSSAEPAAAESEPSPPQNQPVQRRVEIGAEPIEVAPLVSNSAPMASVVVHPAVTPATDAAAGSRSAESSGPALPVQRALHTPPQHDSTGLPVPTIADPPSLSDTDGHRTVTYDEPVVGLVGDRTIEPAVSGYTAAVDSASRDVAAPAAQVVTPRALATMAVQRSVQAGATPAASWPPDARAVSRSSPGVGRQAPPAQPMQFVPFAAAPVATGNYPPELSTGLVVQRADDEPAAATDPTTATDPAAATDSATATGLPATTGSLPVTGAAAGASPASPAGSTSPTEVDTLVRRLYDPLVRRLKAELQLDRERAGRSLDLWH